MYKLHEAPDDKLDPEDPRKRQILLRKRPNDGSNYRTANRRKNQERNSKLLLIRLPHIGKYTKRNRPASRRQSTKRPEHHIGGVVL
jgi:hypothetical protein